MKALNGQNVGMVLWWSDRDKNGIIIDNDKNEYYFDSSVWLGRLEPIRSQALKFDIRRLNDGTLCAYNVSDVLF